MYSMKKYLGSVDKFQPIFNAILSKYFSSSHIGNSTHSIFQIPKIFQNIKEKCPPSSFLKHWIATHRIQYLHQGSVGLHLDCI